MKRLLVLLCAAILPGRPFVQHSMAQGQQNRSNTPTFRATSTLVFLDITVLDKKGRPVVTGLAKDDFTITEDNKPQRIFSFEAPETHVMQPNAGDIDPDEKAPLTIFVLDLLNSSFEDFAYIRYEVRQFLMAQPPQLACPAELMVLGNTSLDMLQGYTRSRADLVFALDHLPATLPFKGLYWTRFDQSLDALQQIALQNRGVPGRKNIMWVGHGGPNIILDTDNMSVKFVDRLRQYVHSTTNMLVDGRISLFVIYPGLSARVPFLYPGLSVTIGDDDPFAGDINFGVLVNETGGKLFYNRNDIDKEIKQSERIGSEYYTLTYQPQDVEPDGKFRRIRVTLRDRNLRAVTKAGYFAPDRNLPVDERQQMMIKLAEENEDGGPIGTADLDHKTIEAAPATPTPEPQLTTRPEQATTLDLQRR